MSERYAIQFKVELEQQFGIVRGCWSFDTSYNVSLRDTVPVVRGMRGKHEAGTLRWGLIPFSSKGVPGERPLIMAMIEKLESSYPWQGPWKLGHRCILPALGFYKWHMNEEGRKDPYFIRLLDGEVFGIAGIWDRSVADDGAEIESCALITMPANALVHRVHNTGKVMHRMPAILRREDYKVWLTGTPGQAKRALLQYPANLMVAYRIGKRFDLLENDDAEWIEPIGGELPDPIGDLLRAHLNQRTVPR